MSRVIDRAYELKGRTAMIDRETDRRRWRISPDIADEIAAYAESLLWGAADASRGPDGTVPSWTLHNFGAPGRRITRFLGWDVCVDDALPPNSLILEPPGPGCALVGVDLADGEDRTVVVPR